jgi:GNAT superfamily N-acetyltransferase
LRTVDDERIEVLELGRLSEAQRAEFRGGEADPFGAAGNTLRWRAKGRHVVLRHPSGRLVASAGTVLGELQVEERPRTPFVGIGGVFVSAPYRGRGLGDRIVTEVLRSAATLGPRVALLFCHRDRAGLYERHGFVELDHPALVQQPDRYVELPMVAMWRALHEDAGLPPGRVTVHTFPF